MTKLSFHDKQKLNFISFLYADMTIDYIFEVEREKQVEELQNIMGWIIQETLTDYLDIFSSKANYYFVFLLLAQL